MNEFRLRSLSTQESRVVLGLAERKLREAAREDIIAILGVSPAAADRVIRSLRKKGWLERASWGRYLLIPPDQGPEALGESNLLALASRIADPYYIGYGTAATHYGLTTQHRNVIWIVTPRHLRDRPLQNAQVRIVNPATSKFFGFAPVSVLGYEVMMSDREKTAIDCIDRPDLAGGVGEAAYILARASARLDWEKTAQYLERFDAIALTRKFGWLAEHVGAAVPDSVRTMMLEMAGRSSSTTTLGRRQRHPDAPGYQSRWKLVVNASNSELKESEGLARRYTVKKNA
jgi:predicted transcriptional regulator of viral defense system